MLKLLVFTTIFASIIFVLLLGIKTARDLGGKDSR